MWLKQFRIPAYLLGCWLKSQLCLQLLHINHQPVSSVLAIGCLPLVQHMQQGLLVQHMQQGNDFRCMNWNLTLCEIVCSSAVCCVMHSIRSVSLMHRPVPVVSSSKDILNASTYSMSWK